MPEIEFGGENTGRVGSGWKFECGGTIFGSSSSQVLSAAKSLSTESSRLQVTVDKFLSNVRAA